MKPCVLLLLMMFIQILEINAQKIEIDSNSTKELDEIVISATKKAENILQAPVSIEKLNLNEFKQTAQPSFFDAIQNIKGIQVITPSLGFKVINSRGFANTTNVRFVQMVDGVDIQAPHIGAPIGNSFGPSDLDVYRVEIVPGSSSAIYGMNAINGIANFITKNAFQFQGISFSQKTGINNIHSPHSSPTLYSETSLRIAHAFSPKFAFKINGTFMKGTDWYANNKQDLNPEANLSTGLIGNQNPGSDLVNVYGDEQSNRRTLMLNGKQYVISRTGYSEKEVTDYGLQNIKTDATIFFRPNTTIEISYTYRIADQNTLYQRTNRFRLDNYLTQQHSIALKTNCIKFKAYLTQENTGNSYNIRSMAENIDKGFKSDNAWYSDFITKYNADVQNGSTTMNALLNARNFADNGRPQPGTKNFNHMISNLRTINNWDIGAALRVNANLYHAEFQHDLTDDFFKKLKEEYKLDLMYGLDFRNYAIVPDGNYFINPSEAGQILNYWKFGGFTQASKSLFQNKIKLNMVLRVDKNQYYEPKINPRLALVYSPTTQHNIRFSVQNGYRFPSIFEAFSNINSGGRKRIGGLPVMSNGIFENSFTQTSITAFQTAVQTDVNKNGITQHDAINKNKDLLNKNDYTYLQPEQVTSLEIGYRTQLFQKKLSLDVDFYYNIYQNLMAQIDANVAKTQNKDSIANYFQSSSKQDRYRLWTNSKTISHNYGLSAALNLQLPWKYKIGGNFTYAKLYRKDNKDGLEDGFNTPEWSYNVSFSNHSLFKFFGFNINFKQQAAYLWQSSLATGTVPSYSTLDFQLNSDLLTQLLNVKIGATNIMNNYYYSFIGGSSIGGFYYLTLTCHFDR